MAPNTHFAVAMGGFPVRMSLPSSVVTCFMNSVTSFKPCYLKALCSWPFRCCLADLLVSRSCDSENGKLAGVSVTV